MSNTNDKDRVMRNQTARFAKNGNPERLLETLRSLLQQTIEEGNIKLPNQRIFEESSDYGSYYASWRLTELVNALDKHRPLRETV
tara:strand:- start:26154 stop:26408 length:255 start_codon:yes stop_codon:yes gene_type:complete